MYLNLYFNYLKGISYIINVFFKKNKWKNNVGFYVRFVLIYYYL